MAAVVGVSVGVGGGGSVAALLPCDLIYSASSSNGFLSVPRLRHRRSGIKSNKVRRISRKTGHNGEVCRAVLEEDAPYAIAIGVCIFSTLLLPVGEGKSESGDDSSVIGPDDVRYAAMGIISFIPLFDWLAWVFAWLDTSRRRYLIYSIVYLAPYLKNGLSLSTDESWLPLASVVACIVHVQLEIAVNNEGLEEAKIKENITKMLYEKTRVKEFRERSTGLLTRLQHLAERSANVRQPESDTTETTKTTDKSEDREFDEWDEKFLEKIRKGVGADKVEEKTTKRKE